MYISGEEFRRNKESIEVGGVEVQQMDSMTDHEASSNKIMRDMNSDTQYYRKTHNEHYYQSHMHCSIKEGTYQLADGHQPLLAVRDKNLTTVFTPNPPDLLRIRPLSKQDRQEVAELGVQHTHRLFNEHLLYAKDVPIFDAPDSHALRNLDQRCERWLRFEVVLVREHDVNQAEEVANLQLKSSDHFNVGQKDTLRLAIYDAADPAAVYMAEVDYETFIRLSNGQNFMIQQFS